MRLKPIKWRKNGHWEEAKAGMFIMCADENMYRFGMYCMYLIERPCRSVEDGKRKAEAWLIKQVNKVAE